jgi:pterin-4a-carbinolamine dehydratase
MLLTKLAYPEIVSELRNLNGWTYWKGGLIKTFEFSDFACVARFVVKLKSFCTNINHYPEILIQPSKINNTVSVRICTTTHSLGGEVTQLDLQVGQATNNAAASAELDIQNLG